MSEYNQCVFYVPGWIGVGEEATPTPEQQDSQMTKITITRLVLGGMIIGYRVEITNSTHTYLEPRTDAQSVKKMAEQLDLDLGDLIPTPANWRKRA